MIIYKDDKNLILTAIGDIKEETFEPTALNTSAKEFWFIRHFE